MGYYGNIDLKLQAQALRKLGYSYQKIINKLDVNKSTLSYWCRNIQLAREQLFNL